MMNTEDAIEIHIHPMLEEIVGQYEARALLTKATIAYVTNSGCEADKYQMFVRCICCDKRLSGLPGEELAALRKQWEALVVTPST